MPGELEKEQWTRRSFLGVSSAAIAAASVLGPDRAAAEKQNSAKYASTDRSGSDPGPTNAALDAANPSSSHPVPTDAGGVQTFKYPFSFAHKRFQEGGWSREVTIRELAIAKTLSRRGHAPHRRRRSRTALAHRRRMGLHAVWQRANHVHRCRRQKFRHRCKRRRPLVLPHRNSALDSRLGAGRRGILAGLRRRKFFRV